MGVCRPVLAYTLKWLEEHAPPATPQAPRVVVHGDFRSANIMAHPERGLAGVVDWELAHTGNRYEDIGWICVRSWRYGQLSRPVGGFAQLRDFCEGYEAAGGAPVDHAVVEWWALLGSVRWALMCVQQGLSFRDNYAAGGASRFENGVVGRRTSECELDCLCTIAEGAGGVAALVAGAAPGAAPPPGDDPDFPTNAELVGAVQRIISTVAVPALQKTGDARTVYMLRVAANALGMTGRSLQHGPSDRRAEASGIRELLGRPPGEAGDLVVLRRELAAALRSGEVPLAAPGLLRHLLQCAARDVAVDQPKYASLAAVRSML